MSKKKILIVTRNLPPLIGGMERLNWHIADELSQDHNVLLISHTKARTIAPSKALFYGVRLDPLPLFLILAFIRTFWICLTQRPDILFAGSGLTAPITVFWAKLFRKKSFVYIHGLDIGTNNKIYNFLWIPCIRQSTKIIANSSPTYELCINKGVSKGKLSIIHPGVSYPAKPINLELVNEIQEKYQLRDKKILISVGRLTQRKGLNEFIDLSLPKIIQKIPNTILIVIGDTPSQSLNKNLQSKELILSTAELHHIEKNIIFTGNINDDNMLSSFYYLADLHIFPVKHIPEDPEGFGMVAIEAATHGTPTIAFSTGGIIDAVQHGETGFLVKIKDYQALTRTTLDFLQGNLLIDQIHCRNAAEPFAWYHLAEKFKKLTSSIEYHI